MMGDEIINQLSAEQDEAEWQFAACITSTGDVAARQACSWLMPDDFINDDLGNLWRSVLLGADGQAEAIKTNLFNDIFLKMNLDYRHTDPVMYAEIIAERAYMRKVVVSLSKIARRVVNRDMAAIKSEVESIRLEQPGAASFKSTAEIDAEFRKIIRDVPSAVETHIPALDGMLGAFFGSELTVVASRPGVGKTALVLQIARNIASDSTNNIVAFFSLEMSIPQLWARMACPLAGYEWRDVRARKVSSTGLDLIEAESQKLQRRLGDRFLVSDSAYTVHEIQRACSSVRPSLVVIDQLPEIRWHDPAAKKVDWYGDACKYLRDYVAKRLDVPVILVHQINRGPEDRKEKRPEVSDLKWCVTKDTLLYNVTQSGMTTIENTSVGEEIMAMDVTEKIKPFVVKGQWKTGVKPVYQLTTRTGKRIKATDTHLFRTAFGWKSLKELSVGDVIATAMRMSSYGVNKLENADRCRLLGYMVGDGMYKRNRSMTFTTTDKAIYDDITSIVLQEFPGMTISKAKRDDLLQCNFAMKYANGYGKPGGNPLREWFKKLGIENQVDYQKRVPQYVSNSGERGIWNFLAGYLATDGCIKISKHNTVEVEFSSTSRDLLFDVQLLLVRLGIVSWIGTGYKSKKATKPIYRLSISSDFENVKKFLNNVPVIGKKRDIIETIDLSEDRIETSQLMGLPIEVSEYLAERTKNEKWRSENKWRHQNKMMKRSTCKRWADKLDDEILRTKAEGDLLWEAILSIEYIGEEEVYDVDLGEAENFIANGIVVHNSGEIEQRADVVLLMHREDLYKKRPANQDVVPTEVWAGKNRQGVQGGYALLEYDLKEQWYT